VKYLAITILATALSAPLAGASSFDPIELEPAINGGVSSSGMFPSQLLENRYGKLSLLKLKYEALSLEPAINGQVSASGLFPKQAAEDSSETLMHSVDCVMLETETRISLFGRNCNPINNIAATGM
jgi:hypothetical protein